MSRTPRGASAWLPWAVTVLGAALVAAGVVVFAAANRAPVGGADFGWTSYVRLEPVQPGAHSSTLFSGDGWTVLWTGGHLAGAALLVGGLLVLAGVGGWRLGVRAGRRHDR